jgi:hypothetical protein
VFVVGSLLILTMYIFDANQFYRKIKNLAKKPSKIWQKALKNMAKPPQKYGKKLLNLAKITNFAKK